jgi:hypothetical protein
LSGTSITRLALAGSLLLGALWTSAAWAQSAEELIASGHVRIRHRLEPAESVYVGQPVRLWIEVMTRTWFLEAPRYPSTIEVAKAIVIPPESFGVNSTERIGGETYAVQGRYFTIFPQTTGEFSVPSVPVTLAVARDDASRSPEIVLRTETVTIEASLPSGVEGHGLVLSTPSLTMSEQYSRPTDGLQVGDSFERRVTMNIDNSVAMLLPPTEFAAGEGIAVYPAQPEVTDTRNRGQMSGRRVDSATYVMEAEGNYVLPAITLYWWNLSKSQLEQEELPQVEIEVVADPDLAAEHLGQPEEAEELAEPAVATGEPGWGWRQWTLVLGALALGALIFSRIGRRAASAGKRRARSEESEEAFFHRFESAARSNDPASAYQALLRWLDRFEPLDPPACVRSFVRLADDEKLTRESDTLEGLLYGGKSQGAGKAWSGGSLAAAVRRARAKLRAPERAGHGSLRALPPLNPRDHTIRHQGG